MATKLVTIRLPEDTLNTFTDLAEAFGRRLAAKGELGGIQVSGTPTRSDMIRAAITGWLMDHDAAIVKILEELDPSD